MAELTTEQSEALADFLADIWSEDVLLSMELDIGRDRKIGEAARSIIHCSSKPRPAHPGAMQTMWDRHYLNSRISLDLFFSPKRCVKSFLAACSNRKSRSSSVGEPSIVGNICSVRRHIQSGTVSPKKSNYLDCTLEFPVRASELPVEDMMFINDNLKKHGVPESMLPSTTDMNIPHVAHMVIANPCVADRSKGNFRSPEKDVPLVLRWSSDEARRIGLRKEDAIAFALSGPAKNYRIPRNSEFFPEIVSAGLENTGLGDFPEVSSESKTLEKARIVAQDTVYLNNMMGISRLEEYRDEEGNRVAEEHFGRISFHPNAEPDSHLGLLDHYRELLRKSETPEGLKEIGKMLVPSTVLAKANGFAPVRNVVEGEFAKRAGHLSGDQLKDPKVLRNMLFQAIGSSEWSRVTKSVLSGTFVGIVPGPTIRGTSSDKGRDERVRGIVDRLMDRIKEPGSTRHAVSSSR